MSSSLFSVPKGFKLSELEKLEDDEENVTNLKVVLNHARNKTLEGQRRILPIFKYRRQILYLISISRVTIICGDTGTGKSTQIPQYLYENNWCANGKKILVCLPRKIGVINMTTRIAEEKGWEIGNQIGYKIRFNSTCCRQTKLEIMSYDILIRELVIDPMLSQFSIIMADEIHERTIDGDLILIVLKKIMEIRTDLKLVLTSATLNVKQLYVYFNEELGINNPVNFLQINGKSYGVKIFHTSRPIHDYVKESYELVLKIFSEFAHDMGDILIFLPSPYDINLLHEMLELGKDEIKKKFEVFALHSAQSPQQQLKVFTPTMNNQIKVIISTDLAENSITIPRVGFVIDSGFTRKKILNPSLNCEIVAKIEISQASAIQRAGRACRDRFGHCFRLYTEKSFKKFNKFDIPEIKRTNLTKFIFILKFIGIKNFGNLCYLNKSTESNFKSSLELLHLYKVVDERFELNEEFSYLYFDLNINLQSVHFLSQAKNFNCIPESILLVSICHANAIFMRTNKLAIAKSKLHFSVEEGDHLTLLNIITIYMQSSNHEAFCQKYNLKKSSLDHILRINRQITAVYEKYHGKIEKGNAPKYDASLILKCMCKSFFTNIAQHSYKGHYELLRDRSVKLHMHQTSTLFAEKPHKFVLFTEIFHSDKLYMKEISIVKQEWIKEYCSDFYTLKIKHK
ncbi:MAG: ATP-dependent RNA helicase [Marteilia pararefringens]